MKHLFKVIMKGNPWFQFVKFNLLLFYPLCYLVGLWVTFDPIWIKILIPHTKYERITFLATLSTYCFFVGGWFYMNADLNKENK